MKNFNEAVKKYIMIETINDLKRNKLTLSEHEELYAILKEMKERGESETIMEGAKNWMVKNGAKATPHGIGWLIK